MARAKRITGWVALGAVVLLGGCGGTSKQSTAKARYVARANQICQAAQAQTSAPIGQLSSAAALYTQGQLTPARARSLAPAARRLQSAASALLTRLRALPPPAGDEARVAQFLAPTQSLVSSISTAAGALTLGDTAGAVNDLQQVLAGGQQAQAAATAYGLKQCATAVLPAGL